MPHYIVVVYSVRTLARVLRALQRNGVRVVGVARLVHAEDGRVVGGVKSIDSENIAVLRGYIPLPESG